VQACVARNPAVLIQADGVPIPPITNSAADDTIATQTYQDPCKSILTQESTDGGGLSTLNHAT